MTAAATRQNAAAVGDFTHRFRCMATDVTVRLIGSQGDPRKAAASAENVFRRVEAACTRFDPASPLMQANAAAEKWHVVPQECLAALVEAERAHRLTNGRFDPRVLRDLTALGYGSSLPFAAGLLELRAESNPRRNAVTLRIRAPWQPWFDSARSAVRIGPVPVDLGGIGKGLAVRWAAESLCGRAVSYLIEAGGDLVTLGRGPDGGGWRAAVEDPRGGADPVAVLEVTDRACATSSIRLRHWRSGSRTVHHIVDPLTGEPGGDGLLSVTVLGPDPALAEVWSKTLFLAGRDGIAAAATALDLAALWVDVDGRLGSSPALGTALLWQVPDGR